MFYCPWSSLFKFNTFYRFFSHYFWCQLLLVVTFQHLWTDFLSLLLMSSFPWSVTFQHPWTDFFVITFDISYPWSSRFNIRGQIFSHYFWYQLPLVVTFQHLWTDFCHYFLCQLPLVITFQHVDRFFVITFDVTF